MDDSEEVSQQVGMFAEAVAEIEVRVRETRRVWNLTPGSLEGEGPTARRRVPRAEVAVG